MRFTITTTGIPDRPKDQPRRNGRDRTPVRNEKNPNEVRPERKPYQFFQEFAVVGNLEDRDVIKILHVEDIEEVMDFASVAEGTFPWAHTITLLPLDEAEQVQYPEANARVMTYVFKGLSWELAEYYVRINDGA